MYPSPSLLANSSWTPAILHRARPYFAKLSPTSLSALILLPRSPERVSERCGHTKPADDRIAIVNHDQSQCLCIQDLVLARSRGWEGVSSDFALIDRVEERFRDRVQSASHVNFTPASETEGRGAHLSIPFFLMSISRSNCVNSDDSCVFSPENTYEHTRQRARPSAGPNVGWNGMELRPTFSFVHCVTLPNYRERWSAIATATCPHGCSPA